MTVYIQKINGCVPHEGRVVYRKCLMDVLPFKYFTYEEIENIDFSDCFFVVGSVECITRILKKIDIPVPPSNYYPKELDWCLHRSVQKIKLSEITYTPTFIKSVDWKLLNGVVLDEHNITVLLDTLQKDIQVWISDIVEWKSEYRVYVDNDTILDVCNYSGDEDVLLDMDVVELAIQSMIDVGPCSYVIDFGVLSDGTTALVEMGDAWAVGCYGLEYNQYFNLLHHRWSEIMSQVRWTTLNNQKCLRCGDNNKVAFPIDNIDSELSPFYNVYVVDVDGVLVEDSLTQVSRKNLASILIQS